MDPDDMLYLNLNCFYQPIIFLFKFERHCQVSFLEIEFFSYQVHSKQAFVCWLMYWEQIFVLPYISRFECMMIMVIINKPLID